MQLKPIDMNIKSILGSFPTMIIPNFQRDYSWDRTYYKRFLDDIIDALYIDPAKEKPVVSTEYFIGTMVFPVLRRRMKQLMLSMGNKD
ncbi:GmrSD restriction endonuclease domain-containing protein [Arcanobacterium phocae]|uniref:GmrSD restriction endonuclease domain-containing protein n=1 Tax=Arcanobacterium phocae TaxID=131112 RepID=UPI001C0EE462|nr:DUF262 domain-containing protein [Arcanobacterium phocae]